MPLAAHVSTAAPRQIDAAFVEHWGQLYRPKSLEQKLLTEVQAAVAARGYYHHTELLEVGAWKSPRTKTYLERNAPEEVNEITRISLSAPEQLKHRILCLLSGVGTPMASALLTVADPDTFTVIDYRAIHTLWTYNEIESQHPSYMAYLTVCRTIAKRVDTDLRTLDRALWQWSKSSELRST